MSRPLVLPTRDAGPPRRCALPDVRTLRFYPGAHAPEVGQPFYVDIFSCANPSCLDLIRRHHGRMKRYLNVYFLTLTLDGPQDVAKVRHTYLLSRSFNFAQDYRGEFFRMLRKRGVAVAPYALIFDGNGTLLWEGHPISAAVDGYLARLNGVPIRPVSGSSYAITGPAWWREKVARSQAKKEEEFNREVTRLVMSASGAVRQPGDPGGGVSRESGRRASETGAAGLPARAGLSSVSVKSLESVESACSVEFVAFAVPEEPSRPRVTPSGRKLPDFRTPASREAPVARSAPLASSGPLRSRGPLESLGAPGNLETGLFRSSRRGPPGSPAPPSPGGKQGYIIHGRPDHASGAWE